MLRKRGAQRLAFEQLVDDIGSAVVGPDVVDGRDVKTVQDPGGSGFLFETAKAIASSE
jgi:hypothetical protein